MQHFDSTLGQTVFCTVYFEGPSIDSPLKWCGLEVATHFLLLCSSSIHPNPYWSHIIHPFAI